MPCQCDYDGDDVRRMKELADAATRAACDMRTILRRVKLEHELTRETRDWIKQHDEEDAARIADEKASGIRESKRLKALAKLNLEERRVLGL